MYKKIFLLLIMIISLCACSITPEENPQKEEMNKNNEYVKSVFITYYELSGFTVNKTQNECRKKLDKAFRELSSRGFNRVTVQVHPYADAFYVSSYFPSSEYCTGVQGAELKYDPLYIMTECAYSNNLSIEAWFNPYRISSGNDFSKLCDDNIAHKWKGTDKLIVLDNGIYFNPSSTDATELIVKAVEEVALNYNVDSICFDDYFYPCKDKAIDKKLYSLYKADGGELSLYDWRRENVSDMIKRVYSAIKSINKNIEFGISPASNIENDYSSLYADVLKWANNDGYLDYICPQIYFGFNNENQPFMKTTKRWCENTSCTLMVALPLYKSGSEDEYAGESGKMEFVNSDDILSRQYIYLSQLNRVSGVYIFSYSFLKKDSATAKLYSAMQNS